MSAAQPLPNEKPGAGSLPAATEAAARQSLLPAERLAESPEAPETLQRMLRPPAARLPVGLDVLVPVRTFRVRDLLALEPGRLIESQWTSGEDLPLTAGEVQLAWSEFEVVDSQLAVRVTRLA